MRKLIIPAALLLFAACSNGGGTSPAVVATVQVSLSASSIAIFATSQASAVAKDRNGNVISGRTAAWTSLSPAVATVVAGTGVVTGVAAGTTSIQATIDGVVGAATITVIAPVSVCGGTGPTLVDLAVGGTQVLSAASTQGCIKIPAATSAAADYLVIAANTNSTPDVVGNYVFKSDEGETVPATNLIPSNDVTSAATGVPRAAIGDPGAMQASFEMRLRQQERRILSLPAAQAAYRGRSFESSLRYSVSAAIPSIGDHTNFKVPAQDSSCTKFTTINAVVNYVNSKVIIYSDTAAPPGGFTSTDYQQIGDEFANLIWPTDTSYFGIPLDLDNNGRVIILYTPQVNKLTPAGNASFVGGFFWAGDLFPTTGSNACPQSNVGELFYVLTPDPAGTFNNVRSTTTVRQQTRGTIAHEFQHMINASNRIRSPILQDFEVVWLDEGLSHFAEDAVGRAIRGIGEAEDANFTRTLGGNADDFNAFFFFNFVRFRSYLRNPGVASGISLLADSSLAARGAVWALLHYTADQYAPGGDIKAYTMKLAGGPDVGITNLTKNAGGVSFDVLVSGWMIANYADDLGITGLSPLYSYKVYDMRSNETRVDQAITGQAGVYPLNVNVISGTSYALTGLQARSGSGNYFFITRNAGTPARTFRFLNPDGTTAASFNNANWILLRTR
jgi:hypothetical protein